MEILFSLKRDVYTSCHGKCHMKHFYNSVAVPAFWRYCHSRILWYKLFDSKISKHQEKQNINKNDEAVTQDSR